MPMKHMQVNAWKELAFAVDHIEHTLGGQRLPVVFEITGAVLFGCITGPDKVFGLGVIFCIHEGRHESAIGVACYRSAAMIEMQMCLDNIGDVLGLNPVGHQGSEQCSL